MFVISEGSMLDKTPDHDRELVFSGRDEPKSSCPGSVSVLWDSENSPVSTVAAVFCPTSPAGFGRVLDSPLPCNSGSGSFCDWRACEEALRKRKKSEAER
jgi:hypothetical protein